MNMQASSLVSAFMLLVVSFCISDFSVQNVFVNSSSITPMLYKISAAWASHEGSMLLWMTLISIVGAIIINRKNVYDDETLKMLILILSIMFSALTAFIYFTCSPFQFIGIKPHQGMGLSPILQDAALSIHPPTLYLGYTTSLASFIYCNLALIYPSKALGLIRLCISWSKFSWMMLLAGVGLGSWWAYSELGWGGYWFFDPVENISLMPLIAATAFHHSLILSVHNGKMIRWTIFLGISTFMLTLLGTFLVRSGLLTSVHTFTDSSNRTVWLLTIFCLIAIFSYGLFTIKFNKFQSYKLFPMSKEKGIFLGNIFWFASLIIILFAVVYPVIFMKFGYDITVSASYFTITFIPIVIPTILLAGTYAYFKAQNNKMHNYYISGFVAVLGTYIFSFMDGKNDIYAGYTKGIIIVSIFSGIFLIISTVLKFLEKNNFFRASLSPKMAAMLLSHVGFGFMVLSIAINSSMQSEADFIGKKGDHIITDNYKITLRNISYDQGENYYRQIAEFWIEDKKENILVLRPENRLYHIEKAMTAESDIYSTLMTDIYAVLNKIDGNSVHAKIYLRPFVGWLWISIMMMAGGIAISLFGKKKKSALKI